MPSYLNKDLSSKRSKAALERLPVNPRRKKVSPDERKRVATACNQCNVRRIKCTGNQPCAQCAASKRDCKYPELLAKATVIKRELDKLVREHLTLKRRLGLIPELGPGLDSIKEAIGEPESQIAACPFSHLHADGGAPAPLEVELMVVDDYAESSTGGKMLVDGDGTYRFHGNTSGATFLDTIKDFVSTSAALLSEENTLYFQTVGSYQTLDSRPMILPPDQEVDPLDVPPPAQAVTMLNDVRRALTDGNGSYLCGGILYWPLGDLDSVLASIGRGQSPRQLALFHAAFAYATLLKGSGSQSRVEGQCGEMFYARARKLLGNPLDVHLYSMKDVPALTLLALYHIEGNRRDSASAFLSAAMNICRMHGVERGSSADPIEQRSFWTLYILDRWLSCLMGRIPSIWDEAIKLPLPRDIRGLPPAAGLKANVELSYISNFIVHSSYRGGLSVFGEDQKQDLPDGVQEAQRLLRRWKELIPNDMVLRMSEDLDSSEPVEGYENLDRALCSLHMAYNQLVILTIRPAFLSAVRKGVAAGFLGGPIFLVGDFGAYNHLRECAQAARANLFLGQWLVDFQYKLTLQDLHHVFNAAVIIAMYQMIFLNMRTKDTERISFALRVFDVEKKTGNEYAVDCYKVLYHISGLIGKLRPTIHCDWPQDSSAGTPAPLMSSDGTDLATGSESPEQMETRPSPPPVSLQARQQLEDWKNVADMALYSDGGCMLDK
ncbi:fungal-specific transcription factor domain-containing protein [Echria macrotheca]|uniref:Fungal-specific transcription factor domain-containing protein n=1 Tax=Echria macrotheca TaxID=438768 RepID=A0AAJ0FE42_9PEZI|nr:fungal-specific transcription factor domain-containing protein [Echria macrotheca]